jgi:hypothetical protein
MDDIVYKGSFAHLTEEEISEDVFKVYATEEISDNELDEPQESAIKKKFINSTKDGVDVAMNYVGYSINQEFQAYYVHLRSLREVLIK